MVHQTLTYRFQLKSLDRFLIPGNQQNPDTDSSQNIDQNTSLPHAHVSHRFAPDSIGTNDAEFGSLDQARG